MEDVLSTTCFAVLDDGNPASPNHRPGNRQDPSDRYSERCHGNTNDSAKFLERETNAPGAVVDLLGRTYLVDAVPVKLRCYNGAFKVGSTIIPAKTRLTIDPLDGQAIITDRSDGLTYWVIGLRWHPATDRLWRVVFDRPQPSDGSIQSRRRGLL